MAAVYLPRAMRIGAGALNELPAALAQMGLHAPAILTDPWLAGSGALDRVMAILSVPIQRWPRSMRLGPSWPRLRTIA